MKFTKETCKECGFLRKFVEDSPRHEHKTCGECWDWKGDNLSPKGD